MSLSCKIVHAMASELLLIVESLVSTLDKRISHLYVWSSFNLLENCCTVTVMYTTGPAPWHDPFAI